MNAKIIGPKEGQYLNVIGDQQWIKLRGEDTNGAFAMVEQQNQPGTSIPTHMHTREDETFYLAEGKVQFTVDGSDVVAEPGRKVEMSYGHHAPSHKVNSVTHLERQE